MKTHLREAVDLPAGARAGPRAGQEHLHRLPPERGLGRGGGAQLYGIGVGMYEMISVGRREEIITET